MHAWIVCHDRNLPTPPRSQAVAHDGAAYQARPSALILVCPETPGYAPWAGRRGAGTPGMRRWRVVLTVEGEPVEMQRRLSDATLRHMSPSWGRRGGRLTVGLTVRTEGGEPLAEMCAVDTLATAGITATVVRTTPL